MSELVVRTSEKEWLAKIAKAYKEKTGLTLIDDAQVGIDPTNDTLFSMGKKAKLDPREWAAVLTSLGVAIVGSTLLILAAVDPEPFSKIGLTIVAGAILTASGGFGAYRVLTGHKPPNIKVTARGFEMNWD